MNFHQVETYLDSLKDKFDVRCTDCIVLHQHQQVFRHLTGTADYNDTKPLTEQHLHDIFSASKVLTMIAVMQLVEQGKLDLEGELAQYLPQYAEMRVIKDFDLTDFVSHAKFLFGWPGEHQEETLPAEGKIRIRHLMSMTSGMTYQFHSPAVRALLVDHPHASTREIVRAWASDPLMFEPDTRYAYSRAHDVLGAVIEEVSGIRFSDYMKKHVFGPCGAEELYYQIPESKRSLLTALYSVNLKTGQHEEAKSNLCRVTDQFESGGGGICCTVEDYAKVLDALANDGVAANGNRILTPQSITKISTNRLNEQQLKDFHIGGKLEYGYGLGVRTLMDATASRSPIGEFGWDGAAGAYVLADPKNHLAVFYVQAAKDSGKAFSDIHPTLRDLIYEALEG